MDVECGCGMGCGMGSVMGWDGMGWWLDVYLGVWEDRGGWNPPSTCVV